MVNPADNALIDYVQKIINSGSTHIELPTSLMQGASQEALETIRQLCKLSGVKIKGVFQD